MVKNRTALRTVVTVALIGLALTLQGCREEEQGRIIFYEKGQYQGKPDDKLTDTQVEQLRHRARTIQKF